MHVEVEFEEREVQFPDTLSSTKLYVMFEIDGYSGEDWVCARSGESIVRILNDHTSGNRQKSYCL